MSFEELFSWYKDCRELFIDLDFIRSEFQSSFLGKVISKRIINRKLEYANIKSYKKHHYNHDPPIPCYISMYNIIMRYPNPLHYDFDFTDDKTGETIMANCIREYLIEKYHIKSSHDIHSNFISKIRPDHKDNIMMRSNIPFYTHYNSGVNINNYNTSINNKGNNNGNNNGNYFNNKKVTLNASIASSKRSIRTYSTSDNDNTSYSSKNNNNNNNNLANNNNINVNGNRVSESSTNYTYHNKNLHNSSLLNMKISQRKSTKTSENTTKYVSDYAKKTLSINELPGMINSESCSNSFK